MKAAVWTKYGSPEVIKIGDVKKPVPKANEILIKIYTSTITAGDCEMRRSDLPAWIWLPLRLYMGVFKPRIKVLGQELAGEIEALGKNVSQFNIGDKVFAPTQMSLGAHAEYICLPASFVISLKPESMSFEEATTLPTGGLNALHFLRKANIKNGDKVLINGAGGSIGTYGVQLAKLWGAEVTCVDAQDKLEMLSSIGADYVLDYEHVDFTRTGKTYDIIIDIVGKSPFSRCVHILNPNGRYIQGNPRLSTVFRGLWVSAFGNKKVINALAPYKIENLEYVKNLVTEGKIKPVIDKTFPIDQIVEAHHYVENGLKKGNVVITI